jgi:hypothetical protein
MKIISIDPALTTGIAIYDEGEYIFRIWDLHPARAKSLGHAFQDFKSRLDKITGPSIIAAELATPQNNNSAEVQNGLIALARMQAASLKTPFFGIYPGTIKAFAKNQIHRNCSSREIGEMSLMFSKVPAKKLYTSMYFYYQHGKLPLDHNVADANALLGLLMKDREAA